ncbi:hypothetical protein KJ762_14975 [bacterium]|nr:hypothetical protein [bacterium]MBU1063397.1 hypothetical protein [bacterium]MBU1635791.1 hypothetical protein [bacterium]MBU1872205.1 hypothetical protein [bacterium]
MEDLACPECGVALSEADLREALFCKSCKTKLRDPKYIDFLELLVYNEVVDDIDFFDMSLYGDEILKDEHEDYDEPDIDPSKFEKRKEVWDEFEDDIELKEGMKDAVDIEDEAWNIFDDEALEEDEADDDLDIDSDND